MHEGSPKTRIKLLLCMHPHRGCQQYNCFPWLFPWCFSTLELWHPLGLHSTTLHSFLETLEKASFILGYFETLICEYFSYISTLGRVLYQCTPSHEWVKKQSKPKENVHCKLISVILLISFRSRFKLIHNYSSTKVCQMPVKRNLATKVIWVLLSCYLTSATL